MTDPIQNQEINKLAVRNGLFIGGIYVVLLIVLEMLDPTILISNTGLGILMAVIPIVLLVVMALDTRKKIGGYWTFKHAFQCLIIMCFFLVLLNQIYSFILIKYYDPTLIGKIKDVMEHSMSSKMAKFGMSQDAIDAAIKKAEAGIEEKMQPTLKNFVINFGVSFLWYAVVSLIIAAIIKKVPKPEPIEVVDFSDPAV